MKIMIQQMYDRDFGGVSLLHFLKYLFISCVSLGGLRGTHYCNFVLTDTFASTK